jgi:D-arabinose 1-dehydrogenase-like Zn-dependent alcohol dehydrogenase
MRTAHFVGDGRIRLEQRPVPVPGPGQLLVRVGANALCGSERGQFLRGASVTPGHEAAGVVVAGGSGTRTAVGTSGVVFLMDFCGECRSCRLGYTNQCLGKRGDLGFNRDGGYAEAERRRLFFAINFNHRYARPVRMAREAITTGRLGGLVFATWRFGGEGTSDHPHANLIETQCHGFDMLDTSAARSPPSPPR